LKNANRNDLVSKDLYLDDSRTRRLVAEISCFEAYRYAQLQNRELKTELVRVSRRDRTKKTKDPNNKKPYFLA